MTVESQLNKSNATNYRLSFPILPGQSTIISSKELTLNIFNTIIPSVSLDQVEQFWQGGKISMEGKPLFEQWTVDFMVSSDFQNWKVLADWMFYINNNKNIFGKAWKDYVVDITLNITDNFDNIILQLKFVHVWISFLGQVTFTSRDAQQNLESNATFVYDRFEVIE